MKKMFRKVLAGAAALGLSLSFAACSTDSSKDSGGAPSAQGAYAYLAIDINPSVELLVRGERVASVKAGNDDASVLLVGEDLTGLTVGEAAEKIVALAEELGYLNDGNKNVKITVLSDDAAESEKLEKEAKEGAEKGSGKAEVNTEPRTKDERTLNKLKEKDSERYKELTEAKLRLIEAIMQYDPSMTYERGAEMSAGELGNILDELLDEYKDMVTGELETSYKARYEEAKAATERRIAEVYGEEYLAAWDRYAALEAAFDEIEERAESLVLSEEDAAAIAQLLGLTDCEPISRDGVVTAESVEDYLDKQYDDERHRNSEQRGEENIKHRIERILDRYDEDEYILTEADNALLSEAWGETLSFETLEDAEDFVDDAEDDLDHLKDSIRLTEEQKRQISALRQELKTLKESVREDMKTEIERVKEELKSQKENRVR